MNGLTDIHSHFLYGLDDGAKSKKMMEQMLDAAHRDGIRRLLATPHITPGVQPYSLEQIEARAEEARAYCRAKGYPMEIYTGAEILFTPAIDRFVKDRCLPTLADTDWILVEFVPSVSYTDLRDALELFEGAGYNVIAAHVERYDCLRHRRPYALKEEYDVKFQMNCSTVVRGRGFFEGIRIRKWLRDGLIDFVGSDAHNMSGRTFMMRSAYRSLSKLLGARRAKLMTGWGTKYKSILNG